MLHSHPHGWEPSEVEMFINQYLNGSTPLPKINLLPAIAGNQVTAEVITKTKLTSAALHYTTDTAPNKERKWQTTPAEIIANRISAPIPPNYTKIWFFTVTDQRDAIVSSELVFN